MTVLLSPERVARDQAAGSTRYDYATLAAALTDFAAAEAAYEQAVTTAAALLPHDALEAAYLPEPQSRLWGLLSEPMPAPDSGSTYSSEEYPLLRWQAATRKVRRQTKAILKAVAALTTQAA